MIGSKYITIGVFFTAAACYYYLCRESLITKKLHLKYDYVIVGGGTAGCVLASRLSEDPSTSVLLIEAGDEETRHPAVDVPLRAAETYGSHVDWSDFTTPQLHACQGMKHNRCPLPRGKVLGGSSSINAMVYMRGRPGSYDQWEREHGCEGWGYEDVLPFFKMAEAYQTEEYADSDHHGDSGPMVINENVQSEMARTFIKAGMEAGFKEGDLSGEEEEGVSRMQATVHNGQRWSTAKAYLRPVIARHNLHVATLATVSKVLFYNGKAIGVEFVRNGTRRQVGSVKEVLISAGAIGTPHVLFLSGVGPRTHLEQMGIRMVADLPVGEGLFDHVLVSDAVRYTLTQPAGITLQRALTFLSKLQYTLFGTGTLASNQFLSALGVFKTPSQREADAEDIPPGVGILAVASLLGHFAAANGVIKNSTNLEEEILRKLYHGLEGQEGFNLGVLHLQPRSRGSVRLASRDPVDLPLVDPHYLHHPDDLQRLVEGIKIAQKIANTKAFKALGAKPLVRTHPACTAHKVNSDAYWDCFLRHHARSAGGYAGTCRMGPLGNNATVVGTDLRIKGLKGIRVVDASVMPSPVSGGLMASTIMIAEKAASIILQENHNVNSVGKGE